MICADQLRAIGHFAKPHGINGELSAVVDSRIDIDALRCIVVDIDGIYVPFFVNGSRQRGAEAVLLSIDGITDDSQADLVANKEIFALKDDCGDVDDDEGFYLSDIIGFTLLDSDGNEVGEIVDFDDSTANTLLQVRCTDSAMRFVPMSDELVEDFDIERRTITMTIPDGILDL